MVELEELGREHRTGPGLRAARAGAGEPRGGGRLSSLPEPLPRSFYARPTREVAVDLLGCSVAVAGVGGRIVETEAYEQEDPACHAHVGPTPRAEVLFGDPGHAYIYLNYGIHQMLNVVTEPGGRAGAVLVRALEPLWGLEEMARRRGRGHSKPVDLCSGPGKLTQALAIRPGHNRSDLCSAAPEIRIGPAGDPTGDRPAIVAGPRIGITKAVDYPWRYCIAGSPWLSAPGGPVEL